MPLQDDGPGMNELFHDLTVEQEEQRARERELCIAPGAADFTFGSVLSTLIAYAFDRIEALDSGAAHRFYTECRYCRGNDQSRNTGHRSQIDLVKHAPGCLMERHLPRLRAMANKDVT